MVKRAGMKTPACLNELPQETITKSNFLPVQRDKLFKSVEKLMIIFLKNVKIIEKRLDVNPVDVQFAFAGMESTL